MFTCDHLLYYVHLCMYIHYYRCGCGVSWSITPTQHTRGSVGEKQSKVVFSSQFMMETLYIPNMGEFTLCDRMGKLLESFEWSDCSFLVGSVTIRAHKLILAVSSPVFKAMLYGPMAEGISEIVVSDIEPEVFQLLLDFIYKDKVMIRSLEIACGLLYAAKKYMVNYLIKICLEYMENSMSINNVLNLLSYTEWIQEDTMMTKCLNLICKHADTIFSYENEHMPGLALKKILQQNSINVSEKVLINMAVEWAHNECLEQDLTPCKENKRKLLLESGNLVFLRFFTLSVDDLDWLCTLDIFNKEELNTLKDKLVKKEISEDYNETIDEFCINVINDQKIPLNTLTTPRSPVKIDWFYSSRSQIRTAVPIQINMCFQSIKLRIKSCKTVFVNSISIPTRQSPEFTNPINSLYLEKINLLIFGTSSNSNNKNRISTKYSYKIGYNTKAYIDLPKPFIFNENEWYTLSFTWPEVFDYSFRYAMFYRQTVSSDGIFTFEDSYDRTALDRGSFIDSLKFCV